MVCFEIFHCNMYCGLCYLPVAVKGYEGSAYLKSTISGHFSDHLLGEYMDGRQLD